MRFQTVFAGRHYLVMCLTTGKICGQFYHLEEAEELAWKLDKEARDKAERELLVAAGCLPVWATSADD